MQNSYEIVKFFASFTLIFIILYAIYYYIQKFGSKLPYSGKEIEIIEMRMIGKNRFLLLVKVRQKIFFCASDEKGIRVLKEWNASD